MNKEEQILYLQANINELKYLLSKVEGHPLMSESYKWMIVKIENKIKNLK